MEDYLQRLVSFTAENHSYTMLKEIQVGDDLGRYWLAPTGDVISLCGETALIKQPTDNGNGYQQQKLGGQTYYTHRLLAEYYLINDNPKEKTQVHHLDFERSNNSINNLIWIEPQRHRIIHDLYRKWQKMDDV